MRGHRKFLIAAGAGVTALVLVLALMDWNWLRGPAASMASRALGREVSIGHLALRLGFTPELRLRDLRVANADWAQAQPMLAAGELDVSIRLWSLLAPPRILPSLRLADAQLNLERRADGSANWSFGAADAAPDEKRSFELRQLIVDDVRLAYRDAALRISADAVARRHDDPQRPTRFEFKGDWHGAPFSGTAETGNVLTLQHSEQPFPFKLDLLAAATRLRADGEIADIVHWGRIDAQVSLAGPTLAALYPTLPLALPETPPYKIAGRLSKRGDTYRYEGFSGTIGASDLAGDGSFALAQPRPQLAATLRSKRASLDDFGPLIGVPAGGTRVAATRKAEAAGGGAEPAPAGRRPAAVSQRGPAPPAAQRTAPDRRAAARSKETKETAAADRGAAAAPAPRVLPRAEFSAERLNALDAKVALDIDTLLLPTQKLTIRGVHAAIDLDDGKLAIDPLRMQFAGGEIVGALQLDSGVRPYAFGLAADLRRLQLAELVAGLEPARQSGGRIGAQIRLQAQGNSVASLLGSADGTIKAGMGGGEISELVLAAASLNGGRLLQLLLGGDRPSAIRCGGVALGVKQGVGSVEAFVFDTEDVRIDADGSIDLRQETLDLRLRARPKRPGLLSVRAPVHVSGTFSRAEVGVDAGTIARAGAAVALALVNPLAALVPLIETGPGEDSACSEVLAPVKRAEQQARNPSSAPPPVPGK